MHESPDITDQIIAAVELLDGAARELEALVFEARSQGVTWAELGELMGVTKQAVQQRFSRPSPGTPARAVRPLQLEQLPYV